MRNKAFTLAEVLLTLVIIGVIAAITIPTVYNSTNRAQYKSALKKAIATIAYAIDKHYADTNRSVSDYSDSNGLIDNIFVPNLSISEILDDFTIEDCSGNVFRTNDGVIYCLTNFSSANSSDYNSPCNIDNTSPCTQTDDANLWIDVNGDKGPNKLTESASKPNDIYKAAIYSRRVLPYGEASNQVMYK